LSELATIRESQGRENVPYNYCETEKRRVGQVELKPVEAAHEKTTN
jgi:hypothetical protein